MELVSHVMYVPMASKLALDGIENGLTGNPYNVDNLPDACIRLLWKPEDKILYGYNNMRRPNCTEGSLDTTCTAFDTGKQTFSVPRVILI